MVEVNPCLAIEGYCCKFLWNNSISTSHTSETCSLRIASELYCHLASTLYLVDRVRNIIILDVSLVGSIIEYYCIVVYGIVYPFAQLLFRQHGACRVVRIAEVYHVDPVIRKLRYEIVLCCAREVSNVAPFSRIISYSCTTYHYVGVDIYRINRVGDTDGVVPSYYLLDVSCVALSTIIDEDLVSIKTYAARCIIVLYYCFAQEVVASLWTIAAECSFRCHFVNGFVHSVYHRWTQWSGYVTDAKAYHLLVWFGNLVGIHLFGNICEQIVVREFQEMFVY